MSATPETSVSPAQQPAPALPMADRDGAARDEETALPGSAYGGLCANCDHASTCTYARHSRRPVLQCEEYSCAPTAPSDRNHAAKARPRNVSEEREGPRGLCWNCENRHTCTFPKPEGGVWQCEEYR